MLHLRPVRILVGLCGVLVVTFLGYKVVPVNATTLGFAYLLVILVLATTWGFLEAALASVLATLVFNFFFLPPVGTSPSPIRKIGWPYPVFWQRP